MAMDGIPPRWAGCRKAARELNHGVDAIETIDLAKAAELVAQGGLIPLIIYFIWQMNIERKTCQENMDKIRKEHHVEWRACQEEITKVIIQNTEALGRFTEAIEAIAGRLK